MLNPNEINAVHLPSLQTSVLRQRSKLDEHAVAKLYKSAQKLLRDENDLATADATVWKSRVGVAGTELVMATCTDVNTGLFVQLVGKTSDADDRLILTFGLKYCQETVDAVRNHRATKIW